MIYRFGEYELDLELYQLRYAGDSRKLEPKAFNVLRYLIEHRDRIVPKEELLAELWDSQYISDAALNSCIMAARRAVGDSGTTQQVVQTQRGRGYRFIAAVTEVPTEAVDDRFPEAAMGDISSDISCPNCAQPVPLPAAFCLHCGTALSGGRSTPSGRLRLEVPLVGRDREAARLQALLQEVRSGKGQVVDIVGEPGMGKSRLIDHIRQQFSLDGVTFVHVFCPPVRIGAPGKPIRDVLRQCCGISPADGRDVIVERLTWWLSQFAIEPDEVMPYLLHVLARSEKPGGGVTQQPALLKAQLSMALRRIFVAYSQRQPLVMAIEDIQWLDQTSADCLAVLALDISDLPVLLLLTRRPGTAPMWYERGEVTALPLQPLADADRTRLLQAVFSAQAVAPEYERALLARDEGHPGLLTQLAQWCADMNVYDPSARPAASLPTSWAEVVQARLACASEPTRHLLQTASVFGRAALVPVLKQMWDGDQSLDAVLQEAISAGFCDTPRYPVGFRKGRCKVSFTMICRTPSDSVYI